MTDPAPLQRIEARTAEIGGALAVNRLLPSRHCRTIGAWCFLDHAGPATFAPGGGMRVGPHPHIGLQTFTWMIKGEVLHRDSLGNVQTIRPGQINLMTAGRGIAHTEESLSGETTLHAAQLWIALPQTHWDCPPAFDHYPDLPRWSAAGCDLTLLAGTWEGHRAPTRLYSPLVGLDLRSDSGATLTPALDPGFEYGLMVLEGAATIDGQTFAANELAVLGRGRDRCALTLAPTARAILVGGKPLGYEIHMWWNFVAPERALIAQAQRDWETGDTRFSEVPGFDGPRLTAPALPPGY
ncbi:pirin family protein [Castellaniella sp. GW247-6E4]|uniref:pirin family protein n=1 Tax=Castellaniella sp. GW247-6E4 TaxID=3140380 RepID=UPI00331561F9